MRSSGWLTFQHLKLNPAAQLGEKLGRPYRDGTTHVVFAPLDFIARLAALVPKPRVYLTRYHGVFAPHSRWRALTAGLDGLVTCSARQQLPAGALFILCTASRANRTMPPLD